MNINFVNLDLKKCKKAVFGKKFKRFMFLLAIRGKTEMFYFLFSPTLTVQISCLKSNVLLN